MDTPLQEGKGKELMEKEELEKLGPELRKWFEAKGMDPTEAMAFLELFMITIVKVHNKGREMEGLNEMATRMREHMQITLDNRGKLLNPIGRMSH